MQGLQKRFGGVEVLHGVNLSVAGGELRGLIGPNGAGKTTLLNIVSGVLRADAGDIRVQGRPINRIPPYAIARLGVSRTFQTEHLFRGMTVLQNIALSLHARLPMTQWASQKAQGKSSADARALAAMEAAGVTPWADEPVAALPQGVRRLVDLARSLVTAPRLLLLDEPLAGLTPDEMMPVLATLRRVRDSGCAVVLVEHNVPAVMSSADRITVLHAGRCIADGPPEQVGADPVVINAYLGRSRHRA